MKSLQPTQNILNTKFSSISPKVFFALTILCFLTTGCVLIKLQSEVDRSLESTVIIGHVDIEPIGYGRLIVAACSMNEELEIAHYTVLHEPGEYELIVEKREYYVFAFWDKNSNLVYEAGEPGGHYGDPTLVSAPSVGVVHNIDIAITGEGRTLDIPPGATMSSVIPPKLRSRQAGAITNLDDERFAHEYGVKGYWEPGSFFEELGGNIYFLEEYDPEKIPVLYVHGATGTPGDWKYFIENLDRTRFQPWFFHYPTGARIDSMSYLLLWKLTNLQVKYHFSTIYFTAHSMGGLVARSFIVNYGWQFPYVKLFISLATPWGGDRMAEYGVQRSPAVIPSWIDMQPESDFIKSLYRKKIPEQTEFYMFYGHKGSRSLLSTDNNDGTISLSSLLDFRPQAEAKMNYAFNEDHISILTSKEVVAQYNAILNEFDENHNDQVNRPRGYLKTHYVYSYDFDGIRPRPTLILRPAKERNGETITFLSEIENDSVLGPFPVGEYLASIVSMAGKPTKKYVPVSIEKGTMHNLDFVILPDGVIGGCVTNSREPEDTAVGMPEYRYRSVDSKIKIDSVTLKGDGIERTLQQIEGEDTRNSDYLILRDDICYNRCFVFFGLPAGSYELTVNAQGYKPNVKHYTVEPGVPDYFRATELTAD
ncbi:alpha/beta hydrolase [Desulfosediminicola flagellatus]|uniref:alpha/beta hydrolase n=1 Tax=Desulfosediminicola flagellatus TaxID=2569541 RepID=UPI00142ECFCC|nr:alpha/beta hydrolase [Desulfosediminicola flagellatus]